MNMTNERRIAIYEDFADAESRAELKNLWQQMQEDAPDCSVDPEVVLKFKAALARIRLIKEVAVETVDTLSLEQKLDLLKSQLDVMRAAQEKVLRPSNKKYRLLSTDVGWSTKPQVHALMGILSAHAETGTVLDEDHIVAMMVKNEAVLQTRQGGRKIWNYYKGDHMEGLMAHGNIERA